MEVDPSGSERLSQAREQKIHGLRLERKQQIISTRPGTARPAALVQQLEALDQNNDDAQMRWFKDFTREHPRQES
ncbi:hypothetical protein DQ353_15845 [Arthrobacter sp. AQ5-05]|nr:hypothetical protein DQ353_15845 [Arthrobacter sp. AQ5-05]